MSMQKRTLLCGLFAWGLTVAPAMAATVIEASHDAGQDLWVRESSGAGIEADGIIVQVHEEGQRIGIVEFTLAGIPEIVSAHIEAAHAAPLGSSSWGVIGAAQEAYMIPAGVSGLDWAGYVAKQPSEVVMESLGSFVVTAAGPANEYVALGAATANDLALLNAARTNDGAVAFAFKSATGADGFYWQDGSTYDGEILPFRLVLNVVPEPASLMLMGLGAVVLLRRRSLV